MNYQQDAKRAYRGEDEIISPEPRLRKLISRIEKAEAQQREYIGQITIKVISINNSPSNPSNDDTIKEVPSKNDALGAIEQILSQIESNNNSLMFINQSLNEVI